MLCCFSISECLDRFSIWWFLFSFFFLYFLRVLFFFHLFSPFRQSVHFLVHPLDLRHVHLWHRHCAHLCQYQAGSQHSPIDIVYMRSTPNAFILECHKYLAIFCKQRNINVSATMMCIAHILYFVQSSLCCSCRLPFGKFSLLCEAKMFCARRFPPTIRSQHKRLECFTYTHTHTSHIFLLAEFVEFSCENSACSWCFFLRFVFARFYLLLYFFLISSP